MLLERRTSFHLKLREEMESHTTFHLGKNSTTVTATQKQDTIEKRCRFKTCLRSMTSSRRGIKDPPEHQYNNLMKSMN